MENNLLLSRLHSYVLVILREIKRVCQANGIQFFLDGGSALGAVRHHGFIPWDDDADVGMLYKDFLKFKKICLSGGLSNDFSIQCYESEPQYIEGFYRIRLNNTKCVIDYHQTIGYKNLGIFVDIFPYVFVSRGDQKNVQKMKNSLNSTLRMITNKCSRNNHKTAKSKILGLLTNFISKDSLWKNLYRKERLLYNHDGQFVLEPYSRYSALQSIFKRSIFESFVEVPFEGEMFCIPKDYDGFLKTIYGDYMKLPAEKDRVAHLPKEIQFNERFGI